MDQADFSLGELKRRRKELKQEIRNKERMLKKIKAERVEIIRRGSIALSEGIVDQREFYEMAMLPSFGDEMLFEVTKTPDTEGTFSMGAMDAISEQMKNFMLARIVAREDAGHDLPRRMSATLKIEWDGMPASEREFGFYTADSGSQFLEIDGLRRLPPGLDKPTD